MPTNLQMLNFILKCHFISVCCYDLNFIRLNKFVEMFIELMLQMLKKLLSIIIIITALNCCLYDIFCICCNSEIRCFDSNLLFRSGRNLSSTFQPFAHVCGSLVILINILTATHTLTHTQHTAYTYAHLRSSRQT